MITVAKAITKLEKSGFTITVSTFNSNIMTAKKQGASDITLIRNGGHLRENVATIEVGHTNTFASTLAQALRWSESF